MYGEGSTAFSPCPWPNTKMPASEGSFGLGTWPYGEVQ